MPVVPVPPPPDEVHAVLLVDVQLTVVVEPLAIEDGAAIRVTVGVEINAVLFVPALCTIADPFPPPHEARLETTNSSAKMVFVWPLDPAVKLLNMIVFFQ